MPGPPTESVATVLHVTGSGSPEMDATEEAGLLRKPAISS